MTDYTKYKNITVYDRDWETMYTVNLPALVFIVM